MTAVGYEFLRNSLNLSSLPQRRPAHARSFVNRVVIGDSEVSVPAHVAPSGTDPLDHMQFALKYEGVNLSALVQALRQVNSQRVVDALNARPSSGYMRQLASLWEIANGAELTGAPAPYGPYVNLFDEERYFTGPSVKLPRWRVNWNGLGTPKYCPIVERTVAIEAAIDADVIGRARDFIEGLDDALLERTKEWAYLSETQSSFDIEHESPNEDRKRRFVRLLKRAHECQGLSEDYLVELQAATVSNPIELAVAFRDGQNWLAGPQPGAAGVTYVPPAADLMRELMYELMELGNRGSVGMPPIVAASVMSFGFVFIHPFMDGNGRLSRFLFHHTLCRAGALKEGSLLPVSIAMQKHQGEYLNALKSFSHPVRELWDVTWADAEDYAFRFLGSDDVYRYWDATPCVEFGLRMAEIALEQGLKEEANFLGQYDRILERVDAEFDVAGATLSPLIVSTIQNGGRVSQNRRKQYLYKVPAALFDRLEEIAIAELEPPAGPTPP